MASEGAPGASPSRTEEPPPPRRKLSPGPGLARGRVAAHQLARIHQATIEITAQQGYRALKVRDIVRRAEVSTRAYYEHFGSKEECFLLAYDLISRRATSRMIAAQAGERDWRKRPRLIFDEFVRGLEKEPDAARLALVEVYAVDEVALERAWRAERIFEGMLAEALSRAPSGVAVPPLILEGIVAGIAAVSRRRLLNAEIVQLKDAGDELFAWALAYSNRLATELTRLDGRSVWRDTALEPHSDADGAGGESWTSTGDRSLILSAVASLASKGGYSSLTGPRICSAARVSRRKFNTHFDDVEDCYLAAFEQHTAACLARAVRAQAAAGTWLGGIYRAMSALSDHVAGDPFLVSACLDNGFPTGPDGIRSRRRLLMSIQDLLIQHDITESRFTQLTTEAMTRGLRSLFYHYVIRDRSLRHRISATMSYFVLTPMVGAPAALAAIQAEQEYQYT